MNTCKGKVLIALLTAAMMAVMAVPLVGAVPTPGDEVTRVALDNSALYGLRIEYRPYSNHFQWDAFPTGFAPSGLGGAWVGQMIVEVTDDQGAGTRIGEEYITFCLDFYTPIEAGDELQVDTNLGSNPELTAEEAMIVNYILAMYEPTDDLSGAAIQCAIWYFLTAEFGSFDDMVDDLPPVGARSFSDVQYQFMTDPDPVDPVDDMYDAKINTVSFPSFAADPSVLRDAAMDIIADVEAANVGLEPLKYPYSISVTPETQTVGTGTMAEVVIEVLDQYGDPFEGAVVCEKIWWESDPIGTLIEQEDITDVDGQIIWYAISDLEDTLYVSACVRGFEAIWVFDPNDPMTIQSLVIPNCVCDEANVVFENECYFPDGHTPGFWKNNARKWLEFNSGESKKYVGYQVYFEDYEDYLDAITDKYGATFSFLSFTGTTAEKLQKAYDILSYGGSDPILKAQKHMLSALLTYEWYEADDPGYYGAGCLEGYDMTINEAIEEMLQAYLDGDYEWAHEIAGALNEQGDS